MKKYLIAVFLVISACSTPQETLVAPRVVQTEASFSETGEQDSGIIGVVEGKGFEITKRTAERYNDLVLQYKEELVGLSKESDHYYLSNEGMVLFLDLNQKNQQPK